MDNNETEKVALAETVEDVNVVEEELFNPEAFLEEEPIEVKSEEGEEEIKDEKEEEGEVVEVKGEVVSEETKDEVKGEKETEAVVVEDDGYSDWGTIEDEKEEAVTEEKVEETPVEKISNWEDLADDLGIKVESYDDLVNKVKGSLSVNKGNDKTGYLKKMIDLADEELMKKELKARGYDENEITEEIDDLVDEGNLGREAKRVRKSLDRAIANEQSNIEKSERESVAKQTEELEQAKTGLNEFLSKTDEFFGGRVNKIQKEQHFKYITSGKFLNEIMNSHENLAKSAWLWRYRDKMLSDTAKNSRSKGFEEGKKQILDNIQNPETVKVTRVPEPETGEFNAGKFLDTENM